MPVKLNLVTEPGTIPLDEFEYIFEETNRNTPSSLYIKGPYMGAEVINKNRRKYPIDELRPEVDRYINEMVTSGRAMGELNHPSSPDVNLERACHLVTELWEDNNVFYGKSKVLSTPCGHITRCLVQDGVKIGMSSRSLGTLEESADFNTVRNLKIVAIDCVADPSFSDAFVNGILESKQWVLADSGKFEEVYERFEKGIGKIPKHDIEAHLREQIIKFIQSF
jgi:hypothetical protein